jgi:hypothetical protein
MTTPSQALVTLPEASKLGSTRNAALIGIAKLIPSAFTAIAVLIPMTRPKASKSGPPELPGLIAASVWIISWNRPEPSGLGKSRWSALMIPAVTVC